MSGGPRAVRPRIYRLGGELATDWMFFLVRPSDGGLSVEKNTLKTVLGGVILHIAQKGFSPHGHVRGPRRRRARPERFRAAWLAPFPSGAAPAGPIRGPAPRGGSPGRREGAAGRHRPSWDRGLREGRVPTPVSRGAAGVVRRGCAVGCWRHPPDRRGWSGGACRRRSRRPRSRGLRGGFRAVPGRPRSMPAAPTSPDLPLRTRTDHGRPGRVHTCQAARVGPRSAVRPRGGAPCPGAYRFRQLEIYTIKVELPCIVTQGEQRVTTHMETVFGVNPWQPEEGAGNRAPSAWSAT
jgi:hypothetical protein